MVFLAGAPYYELVKEREGAPSFLPRCSRLFFLIFPSFSVAGLIFPPITFTPTDHRGIKVCVMETIRNGKVELIDSEMKMPDLLPYFK